MHTHTHVRIRRRNKEGKIFTKHTDMHDLVVSHTDMHGDGERNGHARYVDGRTALTRTR